MFVSLRLSRVTLKREEMAYHCARTGAELDHAENQPRVALERHIRPILVSCDRALRSCLFE